MLTKVCDLDLASAQSVGINAMDARFLMDLLAASPMVANVRLQLRSSGTDRRLRTQECVWESLAGFLGRNRILPTRRLCSRIARRLGIRGTTGLPSRRWKQRRRWRGE